MIDKTQRKNMSDYLIRRIESPGLCTPKKISIDGISADYMQLDANHVLLLVNKKFPKDEAKNNPLERSGLKVVYDALKNGSKDNPSFSNVGIVIYKDGKIFYKSVAHELNKQFYNRNLTKEERTAIRNTFEITPEELFVSSKLEGKIQYFEPSGFPSKLEKKHPKKSYEGLLTCTVEDTFASNRKILTPEFEYDGQLQLVTDYLIPIPDTVASIPNISEQEPTLL